MHHKLFDPPRIIRAYLITPPAQKGHHSEVKHKRHHFEPKCDFVILYLLVNAPQSMLKQNTTVTNKDENNLFVYFLAFLFLLHKGQSWQRVSVHGARECNENTKLKMQRKIFYYKKFNFKNKYSGKSLITELKIKVKFSE